MAGPLSIAIWLFVGFVAFRNWSTQSMVRGAVAAMAATLFNSALHAAGVPLHIIALLVGPLSEETARTVAARKSRDFGLAQAVLFASGFLLVEVFVKLTRQADGQTLERALEITVAATRGLAPHLLNTLILAFAINRSRDMLRAWPIWLALFVTVPIHSAFNFLAYWPTTAGFFGMRGSDHAPFAYVAFAFVSLVCIAALIPKRFGWKWE